MCSYKVGFNGLGYREDPQGERTSRADTIYQHTESVGDRSEVTTGFYKTSHKASGREAGLQLGVRSKNPNIRGSSCH